MTLKGLWLGRVLIDEQFEKRINEEELDAFKLVPHEFLLDEGWTNLHRGRIILRSLMLISY
jgi:hypothetical protein